MSVLSNIAYGCMICGGIAYTQSESIQDYIERVQTQSEYKLYEKVYRVQLDPLTPSKGIPMATINAWDDWQALAKMLMTERANPAGEEELRLIAATAINRALLKGITVKKACLNKKQYSGVMRPNVKNWMREPKDIHKRVAFDMIEKYKKGIPPQWERSFFFCNMDIVKKYNPKSYRWFKTLNEFTVHKVPGHGTHTFFSSPKWDEFLNDNPDARLTDKHLS